MTVAEVAERWHVSVRTVQRYIADGKLKALRLPGGRYRIRPEDADAALDETFVSREDAADHLRNRAPDVLAGGRPMLEISEIALLTWHVALTALLVDLV